MKKLNKTILFVNMKILLTDSFKISKHTQVSEISCYQIHYSNNIIYYCYTFESINISSHPIRRDYEQNIQQSTFFMAIKNSKCEHTLKNK